MLQQKNFVENFFKKNLLTKDQRRNCCLFCVMYNVYLQTNVQTKPVYIVVRLLIALLQNKQYLISNRPWNMRGIARFFQQRQKFCFKCFKTLTFPTQNKKKEQFRRLDFLKFNLIRDKGIENWQLIQFQSSNSIVFKLFAGYCVDYFQ